MTIIFKVNFNPDNPSSHNIYQDELENVIANRINKQGSELKFRLIDKQGSELKFPLIDRQGSEIKFRLIDKQGSEIKFPSSTRQGSECRQRESVLPPTRRGKTGFEHQVRHKSSLVTDVMAFSDITYYAKLCSVTRNNIYSFNATNHSLPLKSRLENCPLFTYYFFISELF